MLKQLSENTGKSQKVLLFEFQRDNYPVIFKRWIKEEQLRKSGKLIGFICGAPNKTPIIELINNKLVEIPFPENVVNLWGDKI